MNPRKQAHFEALGYEPLRMKPAHFASGFFLALTGRVCSDELLNQVAVTKANRGLVGGYAPEAVFQRLRDKQLIAGGIDAGGVELLRMQVNGIVNNDSAMYPAFRPYRPAGNDYTFISSRLLTGARRTDGYAGYFAATVLAATAAGTAVLDFAREVADESPGTLERFVKPLLADAEAEPFEIAEKYEDSCGKLDSSRISRIAAQMQAQTEALARLCRNLADYSRYRRIRYIVLGLLAWLMNYLLATAARRRGRTLLFDFLGDKDGAIRSQSRACYARLRETVRRAYLDFAAADGFTDNPVDKGIFARADRPDEQNFRFLEEHFGDLALRMGYAQPRASRVTQKHFDPQPDTLRALLLTVLDEEPASALTFDDVCGRLRDTWSIVAGGGEHDYEVLRQQGYFGFDEADLERNAVAFADRLKGLNLAVEPSDGLVLCARDIGEVL